MPSLKPGVAQLTAAQMMKSGKSIKSGVGSLGGAQEGPQVDLVVTALVNAAPDKRPLEANRLRALIGEPGGKAIVWEQLCRSRKTPQAGLAAVVEMLGAKQDKFVAMGQEPAACILAAVSALRGTVPVIAKQKRVANSLLGIVASARCSETARRAASWVLRRLCELSVRVRTELGTDRESLQALGRVMRNELASKEDLSECSNESRESRPASRTVSIAPTTPASHASRTPSRAARNSLSTANSMSMPLFPVGVMEGSFTLPLGASAGTFHEGTGTRRSSHQQGRRPSLGVEHTNVGFRSESHESAGSQDSTSQSWAARTALMPAPEGRQLSFPPAAHEHILRPGSMSLTRTLTASSTAPLPYSRPGTGMGLGMGASRPGTGLGGLLTGKDVDPMCVQGNCCCAVGNLCYSDEVIERVCKTEGIVTGVLFLLESGTEWAAGHAARTLGNLAYSLDNCKHIAQVDASNVAVQVLMELATSTSTPKRCRELAVYALGNLSRSTVLCTRLNAMPGVYQELGKLVQEGIPQQDIDRAIANLSQARLGTHTWRVPKKI